MSAQWPLLDSMSVSMPEEGLKTNENGGVCGEAAECVCRVLGLPKDSHAMQIRDRPSGLSAAT